MKRYVLLFEELISDVSNSSTKGGVSSVVPRLARYLGIPAREIVAATLIGEAGGEIDQPKAMQAVYDVLRNRAKGSMMSIDLAKAALKENQFSIWNRIPRTPAGLNSYIKKRKEHSRWNEAINIILHPPKAGSPTKGATHYYAYNTISAPYWTKKWTPTVTIGNHKFGIV